MLNSLFIKLKYIDRVFPCVQQQAILVCGKRKTLHVYLSLVKNVLV